MTSKIPTLILALTLVASAQTTFAAGEAPSNPSLIGILYKQFDSLKTLFVEHQARVQAKLDQFEKALSLPSPNAIKGVDIGISVGNWNGNTPDHLENATDADPNTPTGWGQTSGGGNTGWFLIDLRKSYRGFAEIKVGLRSSTSNRIVTFNIISSEDGAHWAKIWEGYQWAVPEEYVTTLTIPLNGRLLQFQANDLAMGTADARIYDIRVTEIK